MKIKLSELKSECTIIGETIEPLRSYAKHRHIPINASGRKT